MGAYENSSPPSSLPLSLPSPLLCHINEKISRGRLGRDKNNLSLCSIPLFTGLLDGEGGDFLFLLDGSLFSLKDFFYSRA